MNELRIAVPRGDLFVQTLDLLDRLGLDTREVRENDRKLLFDESGIVTMRPSDVPTYVEAGAADLGVTGKDVLSEQAERDVHELLDLGFGPCRMVFATVAGEDLRHRRCDVLTARHLRADRGGVGRHPASAHEAAPARRRSPRP